MPWAVGSLPVLPSQSLHIVVIKRWNKLLQVSLSIRISFVLCLCHACRVPDNFPMQAVNKEFQRDNSHCFPQIIINLILLICWVK